jgi:hypothetical protein
MASAKATATTRRTGSSKGTKKGGEAEVSPARWAGVAFVIIAIAAAIVLAVISPSETGDGRVAAGAVASPLPTPAPTVSDTRLPTARPSIVTPVEGPTAEIEIDVVVQVPSEDLPRRKLTLVVLRGEEEIGRAEKPRTGGPVTVSGVRLRLDTKNELTAALLGPGGYGPLSEPVVVTQDREAPVLALTSPADDTDTYKNTISVVGTSEPGAEVTITNQANGQEVPVVVGNAGTFKASVRLKYGRNRIVISSTDAAGLEQSDRVKVIRLDPRPTIKINAPSRISRSELPTTIRVVVDVTDAEGEKMEGAEVYFSLGGTGRITINESGVTNANGRAVWRPEVTVSDSPAADTLNLIVEVTSPRTEESRPKTKTKTIAIS